VKIILLIFLLVLIPVTVTTIHGTHQVFETQCSISIDAKLVPIVYRGEARSNPDGTVYPGDGFHFLFKYSGSDTCGGFGAEHLKSGGTFTVLSHESITNSQRSSHSHHDMNSMVKKLKITSYYEVLETDTKCKVFRGGLRSCTTNYTLSDNPVFSFREDHELSKSDGKKISYYSKNNGKYKEVFSEEWGIVSIKENHSHGDTHKFEDSISINSFEELVQSTCNGLGKFEGCVFGHAEINTDPDLELCLYEELEKRGINIDEIKTPDVCVYDQNQLNLTVKGTKIVCGYSDKGIKICKSVVVKSVKSVQPNILSPDFEIILTKPPVKTILYYDSKNLSGTYYPNDVIAIIHEPSLLWKEVRAETIQFETSKGFDLEKLEDYDCKENNCNHMISVDKLHPSIISLENGQGISLFNADLGNPSFHYTIIAKNLDREISKVDGYIDADVVENNPKYESYSYPLLKDVQEYTFDDRQAVALHYFGNERDGVIHTDERSLINRFYNIGVMYDLPDPYYIIQNFTFSEGINVSDDVLALESYNKTAMFLQEGYGKLYFDWPINDIVSPYGFNMYNNVTSYTTLYSENFAAKDTMLNHFELRYPETAFTKDIIIKSINQNGTIITTDKIEFNIIPYKNKSEYLNVYLYNKILYDTENKIFAEIVSGDTNPMNHTLTGFGMINGTIAKTMVLFENYDIYIGDSIKKLDAMLIDNSIYERQGDDLLYRSPSDIVLSHLTPHTFKITVNDSITREFDMRYYDFGGKQTMTINIQDDNKLTVTRDIGFTKIQKPENFGYIDVLFVNDKPVNQNCRNGCVLFLLPPGELEIVAKNVWSGVASATVPKEPEPVIKEPKEPDYEFMITVAFFALIGYMIYKRFIKGKI